MRALDAADDRRAGRARGRRRRRPRRISTPLGVARLEPIGRALLEAGDEAFEEVALAALELDDRRARRGVSARDLQRVGREGADRPAGRRQMRPEDGERIGLARRRDRVDVALVRLPDSRAMPSPPLPQATGRNGAFQISCAYSAIVRSDENQPTLAVLMMLDRSQRLAVAPGLVDLHLRRPNRRRNRRRP